jgi:PTS system mannose-specific IIB component
MISLIRIDDRLIHGQVMAVWARVLNTTHILVIDDDSAADAFAQQVMQLAMPAGMHLRVSRVDDSAPLLTFAAQDASRTLILLKDVHTAVRVHRLYPYRELNVGGIGMAPGRQMLWRSIAAAPDEVQQLRSLTAQGVDVYLQMVPGDEKRHIAAVQEHEH